MFSHGLTASRNFYQVTASELASNGFIVFLIDHHDGTCCYSENKAGDKQVFFDATVPFLNYDDMHAKVKVRENETKLLIDFISKPTFMKEELGLDSEMDIGKLVMAGHSMGGATALRVGESDERVRCVVTHDPWLTPLHKEISAGTFTRYRKEQSVLLLNTEKFMEVSDLNDGFIPKQVHSKLIDFLMPC